MDTNFEELNLFKRYEFRIAWHEQIWEQILMRICSDEDAKKTI